MAEALARRAPRVHRRREVDENLLVEEVGKWSVADIVQEPGDPQGLHNEALARDRLSSDRESRSQRRIERASPQPGLVHHPEAMREPGVLGGREDPSCALELADPAEALDPRGVEEVLLRG